jgi:hypothetical protein
VLSATGEPVANAIVLIGARNPDAREDEGGIVTLAPHSHYWFVLQPQSESRRLSKERVVPIVNAPQVDISELVGFLCNGETFAMGWWQRSDGKFSVSLRSRGDFDVSELAKAHGGGGHRNAAGFLTESMPLTGVPFRG